MVALIFAAALAVPAQTLVVLSRAPGAIEFHALSGQALSTLPLAGGPTAMAATPDRRTLLVALAQADAVALIDVAQHRESARIALGDYHEPRAMASVHPAQCYVVTARPSALLIIDLKRHKLGRAIPLSAAEPRALVVSADQRRAWIGHAGGSVAVVDLFNRRQTHLIELGSALEDLALTADEKNLYVTSGAQPLLWVVDAVAGKLRRQVGAAGTPARVTPSSDPNRLLVTLRDSGELAEWNTHLHLERRRVEAGAGCAAIAVDPASGAVAVARPAAREVRVFSYPDLAEQPSITPANRPDGVLILPAPLGRE
jgi:DNA-binding beta-propeller fold protein YncE